MRTSDRRGATKGADPVIMLAARILRFGAILWPRRRSLWSRQVEVMMKVARGGDDYEASLNWAGYFALGAYGTVAVLAGLLAAVTLFVANYFEYRLFASIAAVLVGVLVWAACVGLGISNRWINKRKNRQTPRYHRWVLGISTIIGLIVTALILHGRHVI